MSGPQYSFNVDGAADFTKYRTFGFFDEREPGMPAYQSVAHREVKAAIARELQARGYQRAKQRELLVNIHLQRRDRASSEQQSPDYYSYRRGYYDWRTGVPVAPANYTEGTLNVDVVDPASRQLLWEGIAVGSVSQRMYENLEHSIDTVVAKLFERFPRQPVSPQVSS